MFYITTPIPYTNSAPHLGHLLEAVFNDTVARFYRRLDEQTILSMGLDQHGLKIYQKAQEHQQPPEEFVQQQSQVFKDLWAQFHIRYDVFVETATPGHKAIAQLAWQKMAEKGLIYKKNYQGWYCVGDEAFVTEKDLVDGYCPNHPGQKPILMQEENYFFKLSNFAKETRTFLQTADIRPDYVRKEFLNFVEEGLQDISISREKSKLPWGISVPGDPEQVMYVWFEALLNYITAVVNPSTLENLVTAGSEYPALQEAVWRQIQARLPIDLMYLGKDIAKFHLVVWIGMLSALDLPWPKRALVHGFINDASGRKFSKSLGNGVTPQELVAKFGVDGSRFILLKEINVDGDTNFDWNKVTAAYNAHLADNIGNLLLRVTTLVDRFMDGRVDLDSPDSPFDFSLAYNKLQELDTRAALEVILAGATWGNETLEKQKPWVLFRAGKVREAEAVLTSLCKLLLDLSQVLSIFLPDSGQQIYEILTSDKIRKAPVLFPKVELT